MNHRRPPIPAIIILVLIIAFSIYFIVAQTMQEKDGILTASGTIEATQVNIAPELAGKVMEVLVEEGQFVTKDQPLLRLDPSLLTAQRAVASAAVDSANAALASAQTKYDQTLEAARASEFIQNPQIWQTNSLNEFNQPNWYFDHNELINAAIAEMENAFTEVLETGGNLNKVLEDRANDELNTAILLLAMKQAAFLTAQDVKEQAERMPSNGEFLEAANERYEIAKSQLEDAQEIFDKLVDEEMADDILYARGQQLAARQRYYAAYTRLLALQTGVYSPIVDSALQNLNQAKTTVAQAEASLALVEAQIAKLTINAPMDGVILTRNVEPGEFIQPGAVALKLADLNNLTITVYVPEDRYGEITLGQTAEVSVDSFPDEVFIATVIHISDKAEFTPRNVQTVEGRSSTVYAIKLKVENADGKLKIGMPADVIFK
ncbi:MAG TPA: efflux RND transporter periplasmic adaptor subunit [Anaerolineales bacterium]|nr:efflux RND transporter periplasmic adaptor subunit [Anaerolineales bacterium]